MVPEDVSERDAGDEPDRSRPLPGDGLALFDDGLHAQLADLLVRVDALLTEIRIRIEVEQALEHFLVERLRQIRAVLGALRLRQVAAPRGQLRGFNGLVGQTPR